jgi:O-methyltransferase
MSMNLSRIRIRLLKGLKNLAFYSPFRRFVIHRHGLRFTPEQLCFMIRCLNETRSIPGDVVEIGCAGGQTTVFLNKHLDAAGETSRKYLCLDTFEGFTDADIAFEIEHRGKERFRNRFQTGFRLNDVRWFREMLRWNRVDRASCIQCDVCQFEFPPDQEISFALVDVDLYRPTVAALGKVFDKLSGGGVMLVDDCMDVVAHDGSGQAYEEFLKVRNLRGEIVCGRMGLIRKPTAS